MRNQESAGALKSPENTQETGRPEGESKTFSVSPDDRPQTENTRVQNPESGEGRPAASGTCGNCVRFRPTDGYCAMLGRYVNALTIEQCFVGEGETPPFRAERKRRAYAAIHELAVARNKRLALRSQKYCPQCKKTLPIEEFGHASRRPDGHSAYCKACTRIYNQRKRGV